MTSFTANLTAADAIARHTISERVAAAQARALVREAKAARKAARRAARQAARQDQPRRASASQGHALPVWAARFTFPVR